MTEHWRPGRSVGRTVYTHRGDDPTGKLIGLMDTPELAALVCDAVNAKLAADNALNAAYRERARLVAHLAAAHPSLITETDDEDWPIIYITTPKGQMSWHLNRRDLDLFGHVERIEYGDERGACWDGHDTAEKYQRLAELTADLAEQEAGQALPTWED